MKAFAIYIRNISLLLCGGLILFLYINIALQNVLAEKQIDQKANISQTHSSMLSIYSDMILKFVPALKS